jgi:spore maturation protein CgeB
MRILMFYHSLLSDWNHGNAHFLRGIASELISRGHDLQVFEPEDSWSYQNLAHEHGEKSIHCFEAAYPGLKSTRYNFEELNLESALDGADLVLVHEWNSPELVRRIGEHRRSDGDYVLFFHDTHHRMITAPQSMAAYDLKNFNGVLAYGKVLQQMYETRGVQRAWTWHEAADTRVFKPIPNSEKIGDVVWIGNWGDDERTNELHEFLIDPAQELKLSARIYGVRYPENAKKTLADAGINYAGWLPNFDAPKIFSKFKFTVHVPRRPYVRALRGIPTIRPFEAMACGIPLISSPWEDSEKLFRTHCDYLVAKNGSEMKRQIRAVLHEPDLARELARSGLETIQKRHTCKHRVDELLEIFDKLKPKTEYRKVKTEIVEASL